MGDIADDGATLKALSWSSVHRPCFTASNLVSGISLALHTLLSSCSYFISILFLVCVSFSSLFSSIWRFRAPNIPLKAQGHGQASSARTGSLLFNSLSFFAWYFLLASFILLSFSPMIIIIIKYSRYHSIALSFQYSPEWTSHRYGSAGWGVLAAMHKNGILQMPRHHLITSWAWSLAFFAQHHLLQHPSSWPTCHPTPSMDWIGRAEVSYFVRGE